MTPVVTFFNSRAGVGTTWLVYHLAWMYAERRTRVLAVDLDPDAALTGLFFDERSAAHVGVGDEPVEVAGLRWLIAPRVEPVARDLFALVGTPRDVVVSSDAAGPMLKDLLVRRAAEVEAEVILVDVRSGLQELNRAVLAASDHVVAVSTSDAYAIAGVRELGAWMRGQRGRIRPDGYILGPQRDPRRAFAPEGRRWTARIVAAYAEWVLETTASTTDPRQDPSCLGITRYYPGVAAMAREARKPIFLLTAADGALGSHGAAAQQAYGDFEQLAERIAGATWRTGAPGVAGTPA